MLEPSRDIVRRVGDMTCWPTPIRPPTTTRPVRSCTSSTTSPLARSTGSSPPTNAPHEGTTFENGSWLEGRLLLFDLGCFKHHRFARIEENGGFFVSRLKRSSNPEIVEDLRTWRGNAKPLVGEQVWDVIDDLHREEIDALVEVTFRRRAYRGRRLLDGVQQLEAAVEAGDVSYVSVVARKTG
jgi:hypothetical protein